jgi:putative spermidine/putrescine transport system ATP-binding protein
VLETPGGLIAVRNDHMRIAIDPPEDSEPGLAARVTDVEYQGTYVLIGLQLEGVSPERSGVSVLLPEKAFGSHPYAVGDAVRLSWSPADARRLGPGAVRPEGEPPAGPVSRPAPLSALASMAA